MHKNSNEFHLKPINAIIKKNVKNSHKIFLKNRRNVFESPYPYSDVAVFGLNVFRVSTIQRIKERQSKTGKAMLVLNSCVSLIRWYPKWVWQATHIHGNRLQYTQRIRFSELTFSLWICYRSAECATQYQATFWKTNVSLLCVGSRYTFDPCFVSQWFASRAHFATVCIE